MRGRTTSKKGQSSLELLVTLSFGLIILLPIVVLAFIQVSTSTSTLAATEAQGAATKLADIATAVGSQGAPAKQLALIQVPPNVKNISIGCTTSDCVGHEIIFVINTNAGPSYITAYTPVNVSGNLQQAIQTGTYLVNISAQNSCSSSGPCVHMQLA
jgi:uncharacterized protein (UPF0333 family)